MGDTIAGVSQSRRIVEQTAAGGWRLARHTYDFSVSGGAQGTFDIFTVTGTVLAQVFGVCQTLLDSGGAATIELGITGNTAALIAQTDATALDAYETWQDAGPEANPGAVDLTGRSFVLTNGADVILTVATADLTAGVVDFYALWAPLSLDGALVSA